MTTTPTMVDVIRGGAWAALGFLVPTCFSLLAYRQSMNDLESDVVSQAKHPYWFEVSFLAAYVREEFRDCRTALLFDVAALILIYVFPTNRYAVVVSAVIVVVAVIFTVLELAAIKLKARKYYAQRNLKTPPRPGTQPKRQRGKDRLIAFLEKECTP